MKTKTLLASIAASGLLMAQPALAATRSFDSLPQSGVQSVAPVDRVDSVDAESEQFVGNSLLIVLAFLAAILAAIAATTGGKSPG